MTAARLVEPPPLYGSAGRALSIRLRVRARAGWYTVGVHCLARNE